MKEKIVEILIYLMSEIRDNKRVADIDLGGLARKGYTQTEISAALSWLYESMNVTESGTRVSESHPGSWRVLHEAEKQVIGTEAFGYLVQLRALGILDDTDLETVIERAMMSGYEKLSFDEVREIAGSVILSHPVSGTTRSMLNSKDTIN